MSRQASHRRRRSKHRHHPPPYLTSQGTVAAFLSLTAALVVFVRPQWTTPIFGQPFGAYSLGAVGAIVTLAVSHKWPARVGNGHPVRIITVTAFRIFSASLLGGIGYTVAAGLVESGGAAWAGALLLGLAEKPLNDMVLSGLGVVTPAETDTSGA